MKKAISAATSAALLASLLATAVAPGAFASVTVTSAGNVPQGGTSAGTATFVLTEQAINSLPTDAAGSIDICILPALPGAGAVFFDGTPAVSAPGSLGASAVVSLTAGGTCLTASWTHTDIANIESITITGLAIDADPGTSTGAIRATLSGVTGNASIAAFQAGGTASGVLATGVSIGGTTATVNVTTTGCSFVATTTVGAGSFAFAAGVAPAVAESLAGTAGALNAPLAGQQVLTITTAGGFTSIHNAGDVVTQTGACAASGVLASPGTVVATLVFSNPTPKLTVFPGETNQRAQNLVLTEPSAGFLPSASTFTYKIATAGVVFSTAPTITSTRDATTGTAAVLSAPVLSVDRLSATVTVTTASTGSSHFTLSGILYDVAATVPAGTFISVGVTTSGAKAVSPASRTNAVVFRGLIAVSATTPTVFIGENGQAAGIVSFTEAAAGFFTDGTGSNNTFTICPSGAGYVFTLAPYAKVTGGVAAGNLILRDGAAASTTNIVQGTRVGTTACYSWTVWTKSTTASTVQIGNVDLTTGPIINVNVNQAPGGVNVALSIGSSALDTQLAATVQFATAVFRNQVAVTALSQPMIAPGSANAAVGNIQIAETGLGQLKAGEGLCFEILWRSGINQDTFMNSLATADLPIATASGTGLVISPVSSSARGCSGQDNSLVPNAFMQSFAFTVLQQSTAGDGKVVVSNMRDTTLADAPLGPVLVSVFGFAVTPDSTTGSAGGTQVTFHSTVSNATIGFAAPLPKRNIGAVSALGLRPTTGYTTKTPKYTTVRKYVTWKFTGGTALAGQRVNVMVAKKVGGAWGGPKYFVSRVADANGIVTFWWKFNTAAAINVRIQVPGGTTYAVTTSVARGAYWK